MQQDKMVQVLYEGTNAYRWKRLEGVFKLEKSELKKGNKARCIKGCPFFLEGGMFWNHSSKGG